MARRRVVPDSNLQRMISLGVRSRGFAAPARTARTSPRPEPLLVVEHRPMFMGGQVMSTSARRRWRRAARAVPFHVRTTHRRLGPPGQAGSIDDVVA